MPVPAEFDISPISSLFAWPFVIVRSKRGDRHGHRVKLNDGNGRLDEVKVIFRQDGPLSAGYHYGCRIVQADDGNLFVTLGEHFSYRDEAQNLANHLGKLIRITPDGSAPPDNPFVGRT